MGYIYLNIAFGAYFLSMVFYCAELFFTKDRLCFRSNILPFLARFSIISGIVSLTVYMAIRWHIAQRPPLGNMFESLIVFSWIVALVLIFVDLKYRVKNIVALVALIGLLALGYASLLDKEITPLLPALKSNWLTIHVLTYFVGYAALTVAFAASLILLARGKEADALDLISYKMVAFGFMFLTLGMITGAVWANKTWGRYWSWHPKEAWSLITWFVYAMYLHIRLRKVWCGKKAAWFSVVGFLTILFTYFGVTYLLSGPHSYS